MWSKQIVAGLLVLTSVEAVQYGNNWVAVRRDQPQIEANFRAPNVTLLSPAFTNPGSVPAEFSNGTEGPTSDAVMNAYLQSLAAKNEWFTYQPADYLSEEGKTFPYVFLSLSSVAPEPGNMANYRASAPVGKVRVWIQGGVHGNEPAGDQAVLALLGKLDADQAKARSLLEKLDILVLPRYNPDGIAFFQRTLATNFDPNRDHIKLARQQTRDIKETFTGFAPHVAADMHEYGASTRYGGLYVQASDALFSAAKNLNIDPAIRNLSETLFAPGIGENLVKGGFRWEPYVTGSSSTVPNSTITFAEAGSDAKIGRNALGLTQCVTFLFEMRGIGLADQEFYRRTAAGLNMLESTVQIAADNAELVYDTVEAGIENFINSREPLVVTDRTEVSTRDWQFVEFASGNLVSVPVRFRSTTPTIANLTRARPEAYIIPRSWADLVTRLEVAGMEVETLPNTFRGNVEVLTAQSLEFDSGYYEGVVLATVTTTASRKTIELPPGSFRVSTRQKNAALAINALEPENIDSYVSFNIIPLEPGDEYPVFRQL
ncbi:folic acid synthesis protein fol1 [Sphaceloma murrayae]|uniref:Folic acid synthesis protein fol1 n=1 Tax=Sphaceloma murrayae TaxID=2082308 RepID=A0A2K1QHI5_9PEZI|nr:folic acid synthesis protein fol1 [Sphaceloma murrayae]